MFAQSGITWNKEVEEWTLEKGENISKFYENWKNAFSFFLIILCNICDNLM